MKMMMSPETIFVVTPLPDPSPHGRREQRVSHG